MKRITALFLSVVLLTLSFSACGSDFLTAYIYFNLNEPPVSVDPQTASSDSELLIVRNMYEGLLRRSDSGAVVCGACETFSKNGLTYTFKLRDGLKWSDGTDITANDFVFGIKRAILPETGSPFASRLFAIANAKEINSGKADISSLGVFSADDKTVTVTLSYDDPDFKAALTTAPAMPCNEEFFENSLGKYGREKDYTLSNGSYYMGKWNKEDFGIRLYRNSHYKGDFESQNAAVFLSVSEEETPSELLEKNSVDMSFVSGTEIKNAERKGMKISSVNNTCWVLTMGSDLSPELKKAICMATSPDKLKSKLSPGFTPANSLYPKILGAGNGVNAAGILGYDIEEAKNLVRSAVGKNEEKKFPSSTLYYYDDENIKPFVTAMVGHWQQNLSAFVNIEPATSLDNIRKELTDKKLNFAVFPIKANSVSVCEYLKLFGVNSSSADIDTASTQLSLLKNYSLLPLAFENTCIASDSELSGVYVDTQNGYIDFSFIMKDN